MTTWKVGDKFIHRNYTINKTRLSSRYGDGVTTPYFVVHHVANNYLVYIDNNQIARPIHKRNCVPYGAARTLTQMNAKVLYAYSQSR